MSDRSEERIVILAAGRDGALTCQVLESLGLHCVTCPTVEALCEEMAHSPGMVVAAEEFLTEGTVACMVEALRGQPAWSDLPILIMARGEELIPGFVAAVGVLGMVTVLPRPVPVETLATVVKSALHARRRQYEVRDLLRQRDEADRRKDEFLAMLSHELRNPLAPLSSAAYIIAARAEGDPVIQRQQETITRQVGHMSRLLDDLLDVSRITAGKIVLKREPVDLREAAREAVETARAVINQHRHELSVELPRTPLKVDADPARLQQILVNLLNNAAKYTPAGGTISVTVEQHDGEARVRIRDTGQGISAELLPHLFELFVQGERTLARSEGGLGIGLTMAKRLAMLHGGDITAASDGPGRGSEFTVRLPLRPGAEGAALAQGSPSGAVEGLRVLVVDDNTDAAVTLAELVGLDGHETRVAFDGPTALEMAREFHPEVVLLDIGLPGLDGYEVARRLRAGSSGDALVVAVSGYGSEEDRERSAAAGFDRHLTKPVGLETLQAVLKNGRRPISRAVS